MVRERNQESRILVFDRDASFRGALEETLGLSGYAVSSTGRVDEFLARLREGEFGIVILDLGRGGMSELPLLAAAAEASPRSRFILAATDHAYLPIEELRRYWDVMGLLRKPLRKVDLLRLLRRAAEAA